MLPSGAISGCQYCTVLSASKSMDGLPDLIEYGGNLDAGLNLSLAIAGIPYLPKATKRIPEIIRAIPTQDVKVIASRRTTTPASVVNTMPSETNG